MDLKTTISSQIDVEARGAHDVSQESRLITDAVLESALFESATSPTPSQGTKRSVIFENWEDIRVFCKKRKLYPVVQKREESFVLIKAFTELAEARRFIQKNTRRGPHYVLWYTPGVF